MADRPNFSLLPSAPQDGRPRRAVVNPGLFPRVVKTFFSAVSLVLTLAVALRLALSRREAAATAPRPGPCSSRLSGRASTRCSLLLFALAFVAALDALWEPFSDRGLHGYLTLPLSAAAGLAFASGSRVPGVPSDAYTPTVRRSVP